jgi:hypothetical protein
VKIINKGEIMKKRLFVVVSALALVACGGGGSDSINVSGNWAGTATGTVDGVTSTGSGTWAISQSGNKITGVSKGDNGSASTLEATIDGNIISGNAYPSNPNNCPSKYVLTVTDNKMTGTSVTYNCTVTIGVTVTLTRQ